ncbi:MAG TPA: tetratricopeptide repeat protein [Bdellovibrionota bacterium]|nr:tetratricopeptide repeat protein [Bdellovibrionota bacterium]
MLATGSLLSACAGSAVRDGHDESSPPPVPLTQNITEESATASKTAEPKNTEDWHSRTASAEHHFGLAQAYSADGNTERAIEEYKLTLMYDPDSPLVHARLAAEYVRKGMLSAAMDSCKQALKSDPKYLDARLMLAGLYSTARQTDEALAEYDRVLTQDPANEEAVVYKSQVLLEEDHASDAVAELKKFLKTNNESAAAYYYLGRAEQARNHPSDAIVAYRKAVDLRGLFPQASLALGYVYETNNQTDQAIATYKDLFDQAQDDGAANRLATVYLKQEKYEEALPYLEAAAAGDTEGLNVQVKLGLVYMELKQYPKAIKSFEEILKENPGSDRVHYYLGSLYEQVGDLGKAIEHLKLVTSDSNLFKDSAIHVTYLLKQGGRRDEAREYIIGAIHKEPYYPAFYIFEASLEEEDNRVGNAVGILEEAVSRFPGHEKLRYYLGSLYDREGKVEKSLTQMQAILELNPENVDALNYIGYTWTVQGVRLEDAEKMLRKAVSLKPDSGYVQDSWGWYLLTRGRVSEAVVQLEHAAKLKPDEPVILQHLGDAYVKSNLWHKAIEEYQEAMKFADDKDTKKGLQDKIDGLTSQLASKTIPSDRGPASTEATH